MKTNNFHLPKRPRLHKSQYQGAKKYFVTIKTFNNIKYFTKKDNIDFIEKYLKKISDKYCFDIWLYLFMPDHLHILFWAQNKNCNLEKLIKEFKQKTGFYFKKYTNHNLWAKSYFDHILRNEDSVEEVVYYILNNPVRKDLVKKWIDYKYWGSTLFEKDVFIYGRIKDK